MVPNHNLATQAPMSSASGSGQTAEAGKMATPLRTEATFEAYCHSIQGRLAEHAAQRSSFLQGAYERLTRLLQAARDVEDTALYQELWQHRVATRELLEALSKFDGAPTSAAPIGAESPGLTRPLEHEMPSVATLPSLASTPSVSPVIHASPMPMPSAMPAPSNGLPLNNYTAPPGGVPFPSAPIVHGPSNGTDDRISEPAPRYQPEVPRLPRRPLRPLGDIEDDAKRLVNELSNWNENYPLKHPRGDLNVPNCLRLRALACRYRRLEEEAGDADSPILSELYDKIIALLDGANDQEYTVALDYELDTLPTAYQWGELAERYEEMAKGQEAFDWWTRHFNSLTVADVQPLAEAVAAVQQRFNRLLFRVGARDPFQQQLFDELRQWAKDAQCYLQSLRPKVPIAELVERAGTLDEAWDRACAPIAEDAKRQQTVDNVITLVSEAEFGANPELDERRLRDAVIECRGNRIAASDRRLRDALLPWAAFLEGDEQFKDVIREINLEWERRQEIGKHDETQEVVDHNLDGLTEELAHVRAITAGKRCLLLGGTCREENRRKIEEALGLQELVWPSTKPSDPLAKYDTEIRHADIVALLTRFSRKEWKNAQDICNRDGKKFVHLTTGYGVAQVVRHFHNQICPQGATH